MYTFPQLLKSVREEAGLTQGEIAKALGVSTVLITMIETGKRNPSKGFVLRLADLLDVQASSLMPFIALESRHKKLSDIEKKLIELGEKLQIYVVKVKSKRLKKYAS